MTHADDAVLTAAPPLATRSQKLARTLLLGACAAGLVGLAVPSSPADVSTLVAASSPSYAALVTTPDFLHAPTFITPPAPARTPVRASRSRAAAVVKVTKPAPVRRVVKKKAPVTDSWVRPSASSVISNYGPRWGRMHKGVDFGAGSGAPIRAVGDGYVLGSGYLPSESGYGKITLLRHSNGFITAYAHQSSTLVSAGDRVEAGEVIGYVGSTGHSTGPHLHFEVRTETHGGQVNPLSWLRTRGVSI